MSATPAEIHRQRAEAAKHKGRLTMTFFMVDLSGDGAIDDPANCPMSGIYEDELGNKSTHPIPPLPEAAA